MSTETPFAMAPHLEALLAHQELKREAAQEVMEAIMAGRVPPASMAAFLTALRAKGETENEIAAFATVLREKAVHVQAPPGTLDTCGTGGDRSDTFNISTAVALVVAGMGIPVAKHGNRSVSSRSGSADVLKTLGVNIEAPVPVLERCLREVGLAFLFAPAHHPGLKHAAPVRREMGIRTVFNLLGPLANPALARRQLLGVFDPQWCEVFARVLKQLGSDSALVACGIGPGGHACLDEVSTWGPTVIAWLRDGEIRRETVDPRAFGFQPPPPGALSVDGPEASAQVVRSILDGAKGPARDIVCLNAAAAALVAMKAPTWEEGLNCAARAIDEGRAREVLQKLVAVSNG
jgi:anthranilate phosphoribosyltransferase